MATPNLIFWGVFALIALAGLFSSFTIVKPYQRKAHTVFGDFWGVLEPGIRFIPPFVSNLYTYDMREQSINVPEQEVITQDNAPVKADAIIYTKIQDVEKTFLEVEDHQKAVQGLSQTSLRAVIGNMELDETLNQRSELNARVRDELAEPTDNWGITVKRVEIKNIEPSSDVQQAMEKQSAAERNRRAMVTEAKGEKRSKILRAEGERESQAIRAEGEKEERIRTAQGEAESIYLRAMASATMGEQATVVRAIEGFEEAAKEESNMIVVPYELSDTIGRLGRNLDTTNLLEDGGVFNGIDLKDLPDSVQDMLDPAELNLADLENIDTEQLGMDDEEVESPDEITTDDVNNNGSESDGNGA